MSIATEADCWNPQSPDYKEPVLTISPNNMGTRFPCRLCGNAMPQETAAWRLDDD